jgi:transcriptional regulator with XRE-family HTH domain
MESYGEVLKQFRLARGMSQRALARDVGLNPTLINRSEAGDRAPSGPEEIAAAARALGLTPEEHDRLLASAGYWPAAFLAIGATDRTLRAVAVTLADDSLPGEVREALRQAIEGIVQAVTISRGSVSVDRIQGQNPPDTGS